MPAPTPSLRLATGADEPFLFQLYASTRAEELAPLGWSRAQRETFLRSQFAARRTSYAQAFPTAVPEVVMGRSRPIGALIINRTPTEIRIVDIALLPAHRGKGHGAHLLQALIDEARAAGKPLRLQVLKNNPALRLYLRLGFAPTGENGHYLQMESTA
jgi:ribosomal protein S18 acetylase RimI-like enzyme